MSEEEIEKIVEEIKGMWWRSVGLYVSELPIEARENYQIMMEAVKQDESVLRCAGEDVKNNPDIVMEAVRQDGNTLRYAGEDVRNNPDIVMEAVKQNGIALEYAGEVARNNSEIVMEAVKQDGRALGYAGEDVKNNLDVVMEAVKQNGIALEYAGEVARNNPDIVMEAVKQDESALQHAGEDAKNNLEIVMEAVKQDESALQHAGEDAKNNLEIVMEVVKQSGCALKFAGEDARNNSEIVEVALQSDPLAIYHAGKKYLFGTEYERMVKAIKQSFITLSYNYREGYANVFLRHMLNTIGIEEVEKLLKPKEIDEDEIKRNELEYNEKFKQYYEIKYEPQKELALSMDFFNSMDFANHKINNRNISLEFYKKLNVKLENYKEVKSKEEQLQYIREIFEELPMDNQTINTIMMSMESKSKHGISKYIHQKFDETRGSLYLRIKNQLSELEQNQTKTIASIVENVLSSELKENMGTINEETIKIKLKEVLNKKKENGEFFYSPHIIEKEDLILNLINEQKEILGDLSLIGALRTTKDKIGTGWIRKVTDLSKEIEGGSISQDTYGMFAQKISPEVLDDFTNSYAKLRAGIDEEEAKMFLYCESIGEIFTYERLERMFGGIHEPYPEGMIDFFKKNREEILMNPEINTRFAEMCNMFDMLTQSPELKSKYLSGKLTVSELLTAIDSKKNFGHDEVGLIAGKAGLGEEYMQDARILFETTKERKYSQIPQFRAEDKTLDGHIIRGRMLRADEVMNLFAGNATNCCQVFDNVGRGSMEHGSTSQKGGIFIVEKLTPDGEVVDYWGQSWVWRNKGRLCFDNIELPKGSGDETRLTAEECEVVYKIYKEAAEKALIMDGQMLGKMLEDGVISEEQYATYVLKEVTTGMGMNELMSTFGTSDKTTNVVEVPGDYRDGSGWVDSSDSVKVLAEIDEEKKKKLEGVTKNNEQRNEEQHITFKDIGDAIKYRNMRKVSEFRGENIPDDRIQIAFEISGIDITEKLNFDNNEEYEETQNSEYDEREEYVFGEEGEQNEYDEYDEYNEYDDYDDYDEYDEDEDNGFMSNHSKYTIALAEHYETNEDNTHLIISDDKDWFMITEENDEKIEIVDFKMQQEKDEMTKEELEIELYKILLRANERGKNVIVRLSDEEKKNVFAEMEMQSLIKMINVSDDEKNDENEKVTVEFEPEILQKRLDIIEKEYKEKQEHKLVTPYEEI